MVHEVEEDRNIGDAEIVATGAEAFGVVTIGLQIVVPEVLQANFRRPVGPLIAITETIRLLCQTTCDQRDQSVGAVWRTGAANNRTLIAWTEIDNVGFFFFIGITQAERTDQLVREGIVDVGEGAPDGMVLTATTIEAPRNCRWKRGWAGGRQVARFSVGDFLLEIVHASRHVRFSERASIAQLVGELFLRELSTGMKEGDWRSINVADRVARIITIAEDVGDTAVAEINVIIGTQRAEDSFGFCQAWLVN